MARKTKAEYEHELLDIVYDLRKIEDGLVAVYDKFYALGPKSVAKEFGMAWANLINSLETDITSFGLKGIERRHGIEVIFDKIKK